MTTMGYYLCYYLLLVCLFHVAASGTEAEAEPGAFRSNPHDRPSLFAHHHHHHHHHGHGRRRPQLIPLHSPGMVDNCTELYFEQRIDHFVPSNNGTYYQRYFINDEYYNYDVADKEGPMFFYLGNEADVTLYVNATGLMWENAYKFNALIVFAEHRYYGKSQLQKEDNKHHPKIKDLQYLSAEQAIMDYVVLIDHLKTQYNFKHHQAVIGFGGSYGGMLASWARMKYPHVWDGVIAASAPIVSFEGMTPPVNPNFFAEIVTYDVTMKGGVSSPYCEINLRKAFEFKGLTKIQPNLIRSTFQICDDDNTSNTDLGWTVTQWINNALSYMSMGNFPYKSSYILNGDGYLPAFPVRVACEYLTSSDMTSEDRIMDWLVGLSNFVGVYYNYTGKLECNTISKPVNNESQIVNYLWNYQYCSEIFQIFGQKSGINDMFWDDPWDGDAVAKSCYDQYGFLPDRYHFALSYGSPIDWANNNGNGNGGGGTSNIVWSQGEYDPWRGGGVTENLLKNNNDDDDSSLIAIVIEEAAHHLDLFFSHENDTAAVIKARQLEMEYVQKWVDEKKKKTTKKKKKKKERHTNQLTAAVE